MENIIKVENLIRNFGEVQALKGVSFNVEPSKIYGLVGSDGAGKSTLIRILSTVLEPTNGKILVCEKDVNTKYKEIKDEIGYMPQRFGLYQDLTVGENNESFMPITVWKYGLVGPSADSAGSRVRGRQPRQPETSSRALHVTGLRRRPH